MFEENEMFEEFSVKFSRYFPQYLKGNEKYLKFEIGGFVLLKEGRIWW